MIERIARILEPLAWAALGLCDTPAQKNRRTSSLRKARAVLDELYEPTGGMVSAACRVPYSGDSLEDITEMWRAMIDQARKE